jgi:hypothetical protein
VIPFEQHVDGLNDKAVVLFANETIPSIRTMSMPNA